MTLLTTVIILLNCVTIHILFIFENNFPSFVNNKKTKLVLV